MPRIFNEWYKHILEKAEKGKKSAQNAGADENSKEATDAAPDGKKKHEDDFKDKGAGEVDVPVAGKDYTKE